MNCRNQRLLTMMWSALVAGLLPVAVASAADTTAVFVEQGQPMAVEMRGGTWQTLDGYLTQQGMHKRLVGNRAVGAGDFSAKVRLALDTLEHTAASFVIGGTSHFGFDGKDQQFFTQGPLFGETKHFGQAAEHITPGKPFDLELLRQDGDLIVRINGAQIHRVEVGTQELGGIGLRPWRNTMRVADFRVTGNLQEPPVQPQLPKSYTIPQIDLSGERERHVIVAQGTEDVYQGHPHTLLMPDEKTIFAAWTYNHGGACGPIKRSDDGGRTWSPLLEVPDNWSQVPNCPTIHRLVDSSGKARLVVFAGNGDMYQAVSEDDGQTWSPMRKNGLKCIVAPLTVMPVEDGTVYRMWVHRGVRDQDRSPLTIWQADSCDGGLTWTNFRKVVATAGCDPCEPCVIRSPDGKQLLMLMRENRRRLNSLYAVSDDEGATWSQSHELPAALTGDRHAARYDSDGRLVVVMRDMAAESPTRGHFVAWVGTYADILAGREGEYRAKLLHQHGRLGDCGYAGLERLPDGTFVATTYVDYEPGPEKNSVVSVRFQLKDLDAKLAAGPQK